MVLGESWVSLRILEAEKQSEQVYRFVTPVCEVRLSVQYFPSSSTGSFRFRDDLTTRTFASLPTESKTEIVWSGSSAQWLLSSIIFAGCVTVGPAQPAGACADNRSQQSNKPSCSIRKSAGY